MPFYVLADTRTMNLACLNWAVEDIELASLIASGTRVKPWYYQDHCAGRRIVWYSSDWARVGEIMQKTGIMPEVTGMRLEPSGAVAHSKTTYAATTPAGRWNKASGALMGPDITGATPMEAVLRCYVISVRGGKVRVPKNLVNLPADSPASVD